MFRVLLLTLVLGACSSNIVPETSNQLKVVSYAQIAQAAADVTEACRDKVIEKSTCEKLLVKIKAAANLVDTNAGEAADLINFVRSKL